VITGYWAWSFGIWILGFKNWQTAFEMDYLFYMVDSRRTERHRKIYLAMNTVILSLVIASAVLDSINSFLWKNLKLNLNTKIVLFWLVNLFQILFVIGIVAMFLDSIRRMNTIIKRIPILKKSEKMMTVLMSLYISFLVEWIGIAV
jgi:hypothetical protein